ncbi:hypothetical protein MASR1M36_11980 [Candidatus Cloacimonadaceae bacterium]
MNNIPPFGIHPSETLHRLYQNKPWQGQDPEQAKILFLSLDANWDYDIEQSPVFPQVQEYLNDGVMFWEKYGIHHPMLLNGYHGSGKKFHISFARLGLSPENAKHISFIELFGKPTYGGSGEEPNFMNMVLQQDANYLNFLKHILTETSGKTFFVAKSVYKKLYEYQSILFGDGVLDVDPFDIDARAFAPVLEKNNMIVPVYHFSYITRYLSSEYQTFYYDAYKNAINKVLV